MRKFLLVTASALVILIVIGLVFRTRPSGPRVVVTDSITGVFDGFVYAWVVRTAHGALLIDAGADPAGKALLSELAAEHIAPADVQAVLLTHGHPDHFAGAALFPHARVMVGKGDIALIRGEAEVRSPARFISGLFRPKGLVVPAAIEEISGDGTFEIDGVKVQTIATPGHTPGSTMYLVGDVLFAGDSLRRDGDGLGAASWFFSDDQEQARASLGKLPSIGFQRVADGHSGLIDDAKNKLLKLLAR